MLTSLFPVCSNIRNMMLWCLMFPYLACLLNQRESTVFPSIFFIQFKVGTSCLANKFYHNILNNFSFNHITCTLMTIYSCQILSKYSQYWIYFWKGEHYLEIYDIAQVSSYCT